MKAKLLPKEFHIGTSFDAYRYLGAHRAVENGVSGFCFDVWAPAAKQVEVIGEWNGWRGEPMERNDAGVWHGFAREAEKGQMYKYRITRADGSVRDKADPYAFRSELRPGTASVLWDISKLSFSDAAWRAKRSKRYNECLNIYELHAGSWRQKENGEWLNYAELADLLIPYLKRMHFNFVELLPLSEHPFDGSWGYQVSGYFSLTSRYGTPEQFAYFVEQCHRNEIGVIMDFVPVHFAPDDFLLRDFDGTALYEYDSDVGHSEWGSNNFNFYRGEVCSFLNSAAAFWLDVYHCDGIRMDAVSNAIYWQGNEKRGVNPGGVHFLQEINKGLHQRFPASCLIAEDSSNFLKVTAPVEYDGLGFDYKWDMGFMHDTLEYFAAPFHERPRMAHKLTFSMQYFYQELYLLAFSHDENVHGKKTIIDKLWGTYEEKFAQARLLYLYMYTHPGKKLNFMGGELAQWREWDEKRPMDEMLLTYPLHDAFHRYFAELCKVYESEAALHEKEYNPEHFQWLNAGSYNDGVFIFLRKGQKEDMLCVLNTMNVTYAGYPVMLPYDGTAEPLLSSDDLKWGGTTPLPKALKTVGKGLNMTLAPLSGVIWKVKKKEENKKGRKQKRET